MKFTPLEIDGVFLIELARQEDERGFFARSFCKKTFKSMGLWHDFPQHNLSFNKSKGTVRGMHYQLPPHEEVKIVHCLDGVIDDVIIDLRPNSSSFGELLRIELSKENQHSLYIPAGFAHGFQTLTDTTLVSYMMGSEYHSESNMGFRWNDPAFQIQWQHPITQISKKDSSFPDYQPVSKEQ